MIRREVVFADGVPQWLMISQVEHARLSGCLAELCLEQFGASVPESEGETLEVVRRELLQAIVHHDDGWLAWEAEPPLDDKTHCPLSFDELSAEDSIKIWTDSIQEVSTFSDLGAWVVAGHFSAILVASEHHMAHPLAKPWLQKTSQQRSEWFANWHRQNERVHTLGLAGEALKWLQLFDVLSLWPCMLYPVAGERATKAPEPFRTAEDWILVREIRPASDACQQIVFDPWPFKQPVETMEAAAQLAPVREYGSSAELLAACQPITARWELVQG
ncbi:DUF3891 family protein [Bythopirellula goksoeyrii]|uniref:DUF3891 family protein n=1 Tax=Bythopirellula goksoeyrii TaxID=1400387 RepID=A0A5B9Q7I4_9BACT|nr:DUF3891 family protein [Bythopirellula goksoeyrii]QEG33700.1 hypothetical protein Pr1d_09650 [Bythopirellula goksoeyrii]